MICENCKNNNLLVMDNEYNMCSDCGVSFIKKYDTNFIEDLIVIKNKKIDMISEYIKKKFMSVYNDKYNFYLNYDIFINHYNKINELIENNNLKNKYNINYSFILYKIFEIMKLDRSKIKVTQNKRLIEKYNKIWNTIDYNL